MQRYTSSNQTFHVTPPAMPMLPPSCITTNCEHRREQRLSQDNAHIHYPGWATSSYGILLPYYLLRAVVSIKYKAQVLHLRLAKISKHAYLISLRGRLTRIACERRSMMAITVSTTAHSRNLQPLPCVPCANHAAISKCATRVIVASLPRSCCRRASGTSGAYCSCQHRRLWIPRPSGSLVLCHPWPCQSQHGLYL